MEDRIGNQHGTISSKQQTMSKVEIPKRGCMKKNEGIALRSLRKTFEKIKIYFQKFFNY